MRNTLVVDLHASGQATGASIALVGWGLLTSWGLVSLSLDVPAVPGGTAVTNAFTSLASVLGCALVLVGGRSADRAGASARPSLPGAASWLAAAVVSACSVADQAAMRLAAPAFTALAIQLVASIAYIVLMYQWFCEYSAHDPQEIERSSILSTAVCAGVCLLGRLLPSLAAVGLWAALPLASAACLRACRPGTAERRTNEQALDAPEGGRGIPPQPRPTISNRIWYASLAGIVLCNLVMSAPANLAPSIAWGGTSESAWFANLGGLILAVILTLWYVSATRRIALHSMFRALYPLAAVGLFVSAIPSAAVSIAGMGLVCAGQWALYVFAWIFATETVSGSRGDAERFASTRIAFDLGGATGALGAMVLTAWLDSPTYVAAIPYVLFGLLVLLTVTAVLPIDFDENDAGPDDARDAVQGFPQPMQPTGLDSLIAARTQQLATAHSLSQREAEVLGLLLRGYSTAAIRNELVIAKGTVDTHIYRIYQKCDVHSRQELVELAETFEMQQPAVGQR